MTILPPSDWADWRDGPPDAAGILCRPFEGEMMHHGWFAASGNPAIMFDTPTDERWANAFRGEGIDPRLLSSETGTA